MKYLQQIFVFFVLQELVDHMLDKVVGEKEERTVGTHSTWTRKEASIAAHRAVLPLLTVAGNFILISVFADKHLWLFGLKCFQRCRVTALSWSLLMDSKGSSSMKENNLQKVDLNTFSKSNQPFPGKSLRFLPLLCEAISAW